jgi:hypothetical protein
VETSHQGIVYLKSHSQNFIFDVIPSTIAAPVSCVHLFEGWLPHETVERPLVPVPHEEAMSPYS